ncbi:hypothetical protein [Pseudoduganella rivuli]|uniref:hypothetical protein n=1 Tax=Pseudoduganella rivuli TaxID=2666085 RepID=UPI0018A2155C|nr:hypothetical protein [Pseudoduganella rivuli]
MMFALKVLCLLLYVLGLADWLGVWPHGAAAVAAALVLAAHAAEAVLALRYVRLYQGPLFVSLLLTVLFGLLHVMPLARQARPAGSAGMPAAPRPSRQDLKTAAARD